MSIGEFHYTRPWMAPYQTALIDNPARYTVVEASTKVGKTTSCLVWLFERAMNCKRGNNLWWVAPVYSQASDAYRRLKEMLSPWPAMFVANEADLKITLKNGAVIWFKSAKNPDSLYGADVYACVIDEASRCSEDAWYTIRTTLTATEATAKIIGNVKDRRNWAYDRARVAEAGSDLDWAYYKITAWDAVDAGVLPREEVEDAKRNLPDFIFRRDYEAVPTDEAGNPFGLAAIRDCIRPGLSDGDPVVWGWDLARGKERGDDWTCGIALDHNNHVARIERWQAPWMATVRNIIAITRGVHSLVDSTGVGDVVLEMLQDQGGQNFSGYDWTGPSKQRLMEKLAIAIQRGDIGYPRDSMPMYPLVHELEDFEFKSIPTGVRYQASHGHDDCVAALALAYWQAQNSSDRFLIFTATGKETDLGFDDDNLGWVKHS